MLLQFPNNTNRAAWIDVARACALFLVVLTHFKTTDVFHAWIYAVHIPTFFFISGLVASYSKKEESWKQYVLRQADALLYPFFIAGSALFVIEVLLSPFIASLPSETLLIRFLIGRPTGVAGVLWFLPALFWVRIVYDWYNRLKLPTAVTVFFLVIMAILGVQLKALVPADFFWSFTVIPLALVFYGFGFLSKAYIQKEDTKDAFWSKAIAFIFLLFVSASAITTLFTVYGISPNIADNNIGQIHLFYIGSFAGIASLLLLGKLCSDSTVLRWVGERTMDIFIWHLLLIRMSEAALPFLYDLALPLRLTLVTMLSIGIIFVLGSIADYRKEKRAV